MAAQLMPIPVQTFTDASGNPLAGGKLYSYAATTSTPQATYTDQSGGTPNANPVVLNSIGQAQIWLSTAAYKFILQDSSGNVIWTVDNVSTINPASLALSMFPSNLFTANTAGRAPFAPGLVNTAMCDTAGPLLPNSILGRALMAPGFLSADALGRALMAVGFFSADATGQGKFAAGFLTADTGGLALMANGYLTQAKRAALGQQVSASCGSYSTQSGSDTPITNLSVTITTTGRPVTLALIPDGSSTDTGVIVVPGTFGGNLVAGQGTISFDRGATKILNQQFGVAATGATNIQVPATAFHTYDIPSAGTYTYTAQAKVGSTSDKLVITNLALIAFEN